MHYIRNQCMYCVIVQNIIYAHNIIILFLLVKFAMDSKKGTILVMNDLSSAFDTIE